MIINTNLSALNSQRHLNNVTDSQSKVLKKLSSGLRVNVAADDASGLAISEKMRGQIRGLDMAAKNSQDGISLIQTAEGSLEAIQNMVHRIRELAVQAANDSNVDEDRKKIQEEVKSLIQGIDNTANNSEFNTIKLLNGTLSGTPVDEAVKTAVLEYLNGTWITDALDAIQTRTGIVFNNNINLTVQFDDLGSSTVAQMGSSSNKVDYTLTINTRFLTSLTAADFSTTTSGPAIGGILFDRLITHEMMHGVMRNNTSATIPMWFTEGLAEAVHGASDARFNDFTTNADKNYAQSVMSNFSSTTSGSDAYTAGYLAVMYLDNLGGPGKVSALLNDMKNNGSTFDQAIQNTYGDTLSNIIGNMKNSAASNINTFLSTDCGIIAGDGLADALNDTPASADAIITNSGTSQAISPSLKDVITYGGNNINVTWKTATFGNFWLHVGANSYQEIAVKIPKMTSDILFGEHGIDISTQVGANNALAIIDDKTKGLAYVSDARTALGAVQNRLEFTYSNLNVSSENLSSSESRIRDADMAAEMLGFTKYNVLSQSVIAMLAQANQRPNSVLSLLQ